MRNGKQRNCLQLLSIRIINTLSERPSVVSPPESLFTMEGASKLLHILNTAASPVRRGHRSQFFTR